MTTIYECFQVHCQGQQTLAPSQLSVIIIKQVFVIVVAFSYLAGRWVTNLRPTWDPKDSSLFVVGNMNRSVEVFRSDSAKVHYKIFRVTHTMQVATLTDEHVTAIPCLNQWHPKLDILFSANSGGTVLAWKPQHESEPKSSF